MKVKLIDIIGKAISGEWGDDDQCGTGIPVLRTTNFTNEGIIDFSNVVTRTIIKKDLSEKYVQWGDIILEKSGGSDKQPVGRVVFYEGPEKTYLFNNFTSVLRIKNKKQWFPKYLFYALYTNYKKGGTRPYENKTTGLHNLKVDQYIRNFSLLEINIEEQQKIASILDKVSDLIALRKQQLAKLDELVKSRFVEMFGDPKLNPKCYPINPLSNYIVFLTSGSRGWAQYCKKDGTEWFITIKNVKDCHISIDNMQAIEVPDNAEAKRTKVKEDDLLISITADLGRTGVVTKEISDHGAYINQHLICIRLRKEILNPLYVAYFLESDAGKEQFILRNNSAVKAGLNFNSINTLSLMVPPISEQTCFIDFVKKVDKTKSAIQKSLEETQLLFDSLMQTYFG